MIRRHVLTIAPEMVYVPRVCVSAIIRFGVPIAASAARAAQIVALTVDALVRTVNVLMVGLAETASTQIVSIRISEQVRVHILVRVTGFV